MKLLIYIVVAVISTISITMRYTLGDPVDAGAIVSDTIYLKKKDTVYATHRNDTLVITIGSNGQSNKGRKDSTNLQR